ncbi:hypothetical protein FRB91_006916 [Serendipita sp. 411]|nr:hypothetical protein FRC18_003191 [Serendipita sp. 400]KAG8839587.1 hypothetical protein FRB91_006916 [Serendipita sp. 411]
MRLSIVSVAALVLTVASSAVAAPVPNPSEVLVDKRSPRGRGGLGDLFGLIFAEFLAEQSRG